VIDIEELKRELTRRPTKEHWKDIVQVFAFKYDLSIKEVLKVIEDNMDYIKQ